MESRRQRSCIRRGESWGHIGDRSRIVRGPRRGARCPNARLTEALVRKIRVSKRSNVALANKYGVDPSTISRVRSRVDWATVA